MLLTAYLEMFHGSILLNCLLSGFKCFVNIVLAVLVATTAMFCLAYDEYSHLVLSGIVMTIAQLRSNMGFVLLSPTASPVYMMTCNTSHN